MRWLTLLVLVLATQASMAMELSFKGFDLGGTKAQLLARFPSLSCWRTPPAFTQLGDETCRPSHECRTEACKASDQALRTYGGAPVLEMLFSITGDEVAGFAVTIMPNSYESVRNALQQVHGGGHEMVDAMVRSNGARLASRTWGASDANGSIAIMEFAGRVDEAVVQASTSRFEAWKKARKAGDSAKNKVDL